MSNKSKIPLLITAIAQTIWFVLILLNFLTIWLFTEGVPYTYPLAILGHLFLILCPLELCCMVVDMIFLIMDMKRSANRRKLILSVIAVAAVFIFICFLKFCLYRYGDNLVGVV